MSVTVLSSPAGTARQLQSGGWLVDIGDAFPTWRPDRESARDLLELPSPTCTPTGPSASPVVCSPSGPARSGSTPAEVRT